MCSTQSASETFATGEVRGLSWKNNGTSHIYVNQVNTTNNYDSGVDTTSTLTLENVSTSGRAAGILLRDDGNVTLLATGSRVGIGTTSPSDKLEVYSNGADVAIRIHEDAGSHEARLHLRRGGSDWEIINNNEPLSMPWAGGLNYPQFSSIDYDFDGDLDLLVFDRSSNQIKVFEHKIIDGEHFYDYDNNGDQWFPEELRYRLFAIDYDGDGRKDLFAYGIGGLKVFRNTGDFTNGLSWEVAKEILYSDNWGTSLSLYVSSSDIPAIVDVDGGLGLGLTDG